MKKISPKSARRPFPLALSTFGLLASGFLWAMVSSEAGAEAPEAIRKSAQAEIDAMDTAALFKKAELSQQYMAALANLEKALTASGQLDVIVHVRDELASVQKDGTTTASTDKPLVELRGKYKKSMASIDATARAVRAKTVEAMAKKIREQETALTKAGKVDDALALRKDGERLMLELSGGAAADAVPFADDPRATTAPDVNPLAVIKIPAEKPAPVADPFSIQGRWLESMTVPVAKQKIREAIVIGDRMKKKWPMVVVSPGSVCTAAERGRVELSGANFVATKCRFDSVELGADHHCVYYFQNCALTGCRFKKVGVWYGGDQAAKFYFDKCQISKSFSGNLNVVDDGLRIENSVLEDIEFPSVRYRNHQPAEYLNNPWMRVIHCRFVRCKIPLSFIYLTRDCAFSNCTLVNDPERPKDEAEITKPIEIVLYEETTRSIGTKVPGPVKLTEKPLADLKGISIPTAASFAEMMGR